MVRRFCSDFRDYFRDPFAPALPRWRLCLAAFLFASLRAVDPEAWASPGEWPR